MTLVRQDGRFPIKQCIMAGARTRRIGLMRMERLWKVVVHTIGVDVCIMYPVGMVCPLLVQKIIQPGFRLRHTDPLAMEN